MITLRVGPIILCAALAVAALTPVEKHGKLTTDGAYLLNKDGDIVQLRGMSFYWSNPNWADQYNRYYNEATVEKLVDTWKCTVVRAAYDRNNGNNNGWEGVKTVIDAAIKKGIYVIIDWHSHTAEQQESAAINFFKEQATIYKNTPNVLFEPYNEPVKAGGAADGSYYEAQKTWKAIKPYLTKVTKAIRDQGADNLVILGTPFYSQYVNIAAEDQILDSDGTIFKNVAYSFHFYAASHGSQAYYVKNDPEGKGGLEGGFLANAVGNIPLFITEWGTTHSDGGEGGSHSYIDEANTNWWFEKYVNGPSHISWCNWSVSDFQPSSAFSGSITTPSKSGAIVKKLLSTPTTDTYPTGADSGFAGPTPDPVIAMPGTQPATRYNRFYGTKLKYGYIAYNKRDKIDFRNTKHTAITVPVGVASEWVSYTIKSSSATKNIFIRHLSPDGTGTIDVLLDKVKIGEIVVPKSSTWAYAVAKAAVPAGDHLLTLQFTKATHGGYQIEWIELTNEETPTAVTTSLQPHSKSFHGHLTVAKGHIGVSLPTLHSFTSYNLTGIDGREVTSGTIAKNTTYVSISDVAKGIWLLNFMGVEGTVTTKVIVSGW